MADLGSSIKGLWMRGMEAIGNTASSIATNTRSKVDEMNLVNRRAEILKDFGNKAYALWQKGEPFPEELDTQLKELAKLDEKLIDLRAERLAGVKTDDASKETPVSAEEEDSVKDAEEEAVPAEEETEEAEEEEAEEDFGEEEEDDAAEEEKEEDAVPVIRVETPEESAEPAQGLSDAIDNLFQQIPSADESAEKVNSALNSLEEGLNRLSEKVDQGLESLSEAIDGEK